MSTSITTGTNSYSILTAYIYLVTNTCTVLCSTCNINSRTKTCTLVSMYLRVIANKSSRGLINSQIPTNTSRSFSCNLYIFTYCCCAPTSCIVTCTNRNGCSAISNCAFTNSNRFTRLSLSSLTDCYTSFIASTCCSTKGNRVITSSTCFCTIIRTTNRDSSITRCFIAITNTHGCRTRHSSIRATTKGLVTGSIY